MRKKFTIIIEKDESGWLISEVLELPGCHTQAKSMDALIKRTREAIRAYLDIEKRPDIPGRFVGMQTIEV